MCMMSISTKCGSILLKEFAMAVKRASGSVATTAAGQPQRDLVDEELLGFKEVQSAGGH
jgi:hypothetical protein